MALTKESPIYPVPPSAEGVPMVCTFRLAESQGAGDFQKVHAEGGSALFNTYGMGPRGLLSDGRAHLFCPLWASCLGLQMDRGGKPFYQL